MIAYEDFRVEQVAIEARFDPAYTIWDRSGEVWIRLRDLFPALQHQSANPLSQVFESRDFRATLELERFLIQSRGANPSELAAQAAQSMLEVCSDLLRISAFTRVGFREIRTMIFDDIASALAAVGEAAPSRFHPALGSPNTPLAFTAGMKQEGEKAGLGIYIRGEKREFKLQLPWELGNRFAQDGLPEQIKEHILLLDSDYYTVGITPRSALEMEEWSRQASRSIRKAWSEILP